MELRHLRYFLAVAEEGHFTRAAQRLGIGQPPLSQQIKDLEQELEVKLFYRLPKGAELTPAGQAFQAEAQAILAAAERAKETARRAERGEFGRLTVGFTGSASFTPLVRDSIRLYRQRWPGVILSLEEMNTIRLLDKLRRGDLDAAFIRPGVEDPEGIRLIRAPDEEMRVALPASHPLAKRASVPLIALAGEPLVLFPRAAGLSLYDEISAAFLACGVDPVVDQEVPQMSSVVNLVAANLGVSIVTDSITQICLSGVAFRPIEGPAPVARLALAVRNGSPTAVVSSLITLVGEIVGGG